MRPDVIFKVRCLVALNYDAPQAFEARVNEIPVGSDSVWIARHTPEPVRMYSEEPLACIEVKQDNLPMEWLDFRRTPSDVRYDLCCLRTRLAYDRVENTIYVAQAEWSRT